MEVKEVRNRCQDKLRVMTVPSPFDLYAFCAEVGKRRGRHIQLVSVATGGNLPCGLSVSVADTDYVFYERNTSPLHQDHIVLHEIGHLLFDHAGVAVSDDRAVHALLPDLDPGMVTRVLGRRAYTTGEEQEAEMLATTVLESAHVPVALRAADDLVAGQLRRLSATLEPRDRD